MVRSGDLIRFSYTTLSAFNICTCTMARADTALRVLQGITGQAQQSVPKTDITLSSGIKNEAGGQIAAAKRQRGTEREKARERERERESGSARKRNRDSGRAEAISEIYCQVSFLA